MSKYNNGTNRLSIAGDEKCQNRPVAIEINGKPIEKIKECVDTATTDITEIKTQLGNIEIVDVPESASATGKKGQMAIDSSYLYVCVADNTWKSIALGEDAWETEYETPTE